jgi:N-formylglutamate deformylase
LRRAEDAYVDELYAAAPVHGATLLAALFPRSYIDVNRAATDLDPALIEGALPDHLRPQPTTRVGLIRRHAQPGVPIYDRKLGSDDVLARIERYHAPYHQVLDDCCERRYREFGAVWHVNCHSMPSYGPPREVRKGVYADFVLGDRDGTTCDPEFTNFVAGFLRGLGYDVRVNEGYKGVEIVRRQGRPAQRRHSLQIEVDRALYMDQKTLEKLPGFDRLQDDLASLVAAIGGFIRDRL